MNRSPDHRAVRVASGIHRRVTRLTCFARVCQVPSISTVKGIDARNNPAQAD